MTPSPAFRLAALLLAGAAAFTAGTVHAAPVDVAFDFTWVVGARAGQTGSGTLSFDSSLAVPGQRYTDDFTLTSFDVDFPGRHFGLADVGVGFAQFDGTGALLTLGVGTDCGPGYCGAQSRTGPSPFYVVFGAGADVPLTAVYDQGRSEGHGDFTTSAVPEPATPALLLAGLLGLATAAKRRAGRSPR